MIIGHQKQWHFLKKSAELGQISHAFLFFGQEQLGKKKIALEFIKLLNCQNALKDKKPCQICYSCQSIEKLQHLDLFFVEPRDREIQISQIRELTNRLSLRPFMSPFKAAIVDQAHSMSQEAQTALLKTLEEPKGNAVLILITEYPEMLFPTILSRVQKIKFYPVKKKEIEDYLSQKGCPQDKIKLISSISFGKPGAALNFLLNSEILKAEHQKIADLIKITADRPDLISRFQYAKRITQKTIESPKDQSREILESWLRYFRELFLIYSGVISHSEGYPELQKVYKRYSLSKLREIIEMLQKIIFFLSTTNINPKLALEMLMLEL